MAWRWVAAQWGDIDKWVFEEVDLPQPERGEVTIEVRAAGVNPADYKHVTVPRPGIELPVPLGYEVSGVLSAIGPDTHIADGEAAIGDEVVAFRVRGGYATHLNVPAHDVFRKPAALSHPEAANLLLAATTASQMLDVVDAREGERILLHGASGAVGVAVLQLAALRDVRVVGTAAPGSFDRVRRYGGIPVAYGPGLIERLRETAGGVDAALDAVGTDEAVDASLALVADRSRIVTIANAGRAEQDGFAFIAGAQPESTRYRDAIRPELLQLAADGALEVPMAGTYPLAEAREAALEVKSGHPGGKIALIP